jgi:hypothetical protein
MCPQNGRVVSRSCALIVMTVFLRATAVSAEQGSRTLRADAALLSTRQAEANQLGWWEKVFIRPCDGIHYYIENMRRVRLRVVSPFESWICILH